MNAQLEKTLIPDYGSRPREVTHARSARSGRSGLMAAGGVLGALAASACCIAPLVLFGLGVSGAWIGNLTALAPYQPIFVVLTLGFLGAGFVMVYRKPKATCPADGTCDRPLSTRTTKIALWGATILITAAIAFPYVTPLILDL
ncbi:MAG: mercuric transporter MerT family protein [Acidiferrobacterales bacterium]